LVRLSAQEIAVKSDEPGCEQESSWQFVVDPQLPWEYLGDGDYPEPTEWLLGICTEVALIMVYGQQAARGEMASYAAAGYMRATRALLMGEPIGDEEHAALDDPAVKAVIRLFRDRLLMTSTW